MKQATENFRTKFYRTFIASIQNVFKSILQKQYLNQLVVYRSYGLVAVNRYIFIIIIGVCYQTMCSVKFSIIEIFFHIMDT